MANLRQELKDGSGEQSANSKSDEKGERLFHVACLHQRHDEDSGEGEGIDHCHTQERITPNWSRNKEGGVPLKQTASKNAV